MATSPTSRALRWWRERGAMAGVVERWLHHSRTRLDLFNVFDLVVLSPTYHSVIFVQVTSGSNHAKRRQKLLESDAYALMCERDIDCIMAVQSWRKKKNGRWMTRIEGWDMDTLRDEPLRLDWRIGEKG